MTYQEEHNMKQENKRLKLVIYELNKRHAEQINRLKLEIVQPRLDITKNEQTWHDVMRAVCQTFNLTPDEIQSQNRKQELIFARHMFCYLCRKHLQMSLVDIGRILMRDHSTIINAVSKASDLIEYDKITKQRYALTMELLGRYLHEKGDSLYTLVEHRTRSAKSQEEI
jgi:chromosomal replication initiation ATPase DnaA